MTTNLNAPRIGIGLLAATLHLALLYAFLQNRPVPPAEAAQAERPAIQWLRLAPTPPSRAVAARPPSPPPRLAARPPEAPQRSAPAPVQAQAPAPETPTAAPEIIVEAAPARLSADEILRLAKRDIGKIDKDLRREFPSRGEPAPLDTPQARLERGFAAAHAAVPPKWYQGAKMEELTPRGNSTARTYKISSALLTYCITITAEGQRHYHNCPS
ncbi:hypothetical protein [Janthinobacterium fluminis]|uniref:Uncharacterized protein n=1 Tax=Janthinobacterium fluminis TaxID=2987524 RepID=A0ABT5JXB1_9BURK|nr:hypothetical protein [Janthinobacterium fluminis]MDC8757389.1 hypothetical protein [Janthinobacterium fluminis]